MLARKGLYPCRGVSVMPKGNRKRPVKTGGGQWREAQWVRGPGRRRLKNLEGNKVVIQVKQIATNETRYDRQIDH